jgi:hypothetical protein
MLPDDLIIITFMDNKKIMVEIYKEHHYYRYKFSKDDWLYFINSYKNKKTFELKYYTNNSIMSIKNENSVIVYSNITTCYTVKFLDKDNKISDFLCSYL